MEKQTRRKQTKADTAKEQIAVFNETFARFNNTIRQLNESYSSLQERYQKLSDELTEANERLRQALDQNIETRMFLQNVLDSLTSGVLTIDVKGNVTAINRAGCEILRARADEVVRMPYGSLFGGTLAREHALVDLLKEGTPYRSVEKSVRLDGGDTIPLSVSSACLLDCSGQVVGALEVFFDLSEIKRLEEEIARVKGLAALGEVAAVIAHEVRNPLSGIAGFAALLKRELGAEHPQIEYVNKIITGVEKLDRSVSSLLEYARDMRHTPQIADLRGFLEETVDFFRVGLSGRSPDKTVKLHLPDDKVVCPFDRENLSGAILNLLKNADEAMKQRGTISVSLRVAGGVAKLTVVDQGEPIPNELKEKIFVPFFTTREGGTGLGLPLVRKVVEAHGGKVYVSDDEKRGSAFTVELPIAG